VIRYNGARYTLNVITPKYVTRERRYNWSSLQRSLYGWLRSFWGWDSHVKSLVITFTYHTCQKRCRDYHDYNGVIQSREIRYHRFSTWIIWKNNQPKTALFENTVFLIGFNQFWGGIIVVVIILNSGGM